VGWFDKKRKERVESISMALDAPKPNTVSILDGDENALTPVEGLSLGRLARLHPFSPVAVSLLQLFDREQVSTQEIAKLLQSDPALAAETLAYVNSPLFALPDRVTELQGAILVLGAENIKRIAVTLAMRGMLKSAPKLAVTRRLWRHSVATALIAAELAPLYGVAPDLANTAGVLHDIGRIGLLAKDSEEYAQIVLKLYDNVDGILLVERAVCGMDHCAAGSYLCSGWALPAVFQETASRHHQAKGETGIAGLIHAACAMADDLTFAAISHRGVLTMAARVAESVPETLRAQVLALADGIETRIASKVDQLDF
jgi:putative nucleotidyltransferase with HDIG domain